MVMNGRQCRVLIAEDEVLVALQLAHILGQPGCAVQAVARTGPEALRVAGEVRPDLVTMDANLAAGTSGIVAAAAIIETLGIPVVMISGTLLAEEADLIGASAFVRQPFTDTDISAALQAALGAGVPMDDRR